MNQAVFTFIERVENYAKRSFSYREEIGLLISAAEERKLQSSFDELAFLAKFITNARLILLRDNVDVSVTARLAEEFRAKLGNSVGIITNLADNLSAEKRAVFSDKFLNPSAENLEHLFKLIEELSWFKNYSLDQDNL